MTKSKILVKDILFKFVLILQVQRLLHKNTLYRVSFILYTDRFWELLAGSRAYTQIKYVFFVQY